MYSNWLAFILTAIIVAGSIWLCVRSNILRDPGTAARPPFSFSRVQLLWWVLIIAFCFLQEYGSEFTLPQLNPTCLVLMGIGVGTKALASVIDSRQKNAAERQGNYVLRDAKSAGFFTDILSDEEGLSVHRLQALIFNVIYGVAFYTSFLPNGEFADYTAIEYGVLGISNVAYLGLKALENNPQALADKVVSTGGDELLDVDDGQDGPSAAG
jgi:hypothetical protein